MAAALVGANDFAGAAIFTEVAAFTLATALAMATTLELERCYAVNDASKEVFIADLL